MSGWCLRQPGLQYDEELFANAAMGNVDESFIAYELELGGLRVPLMRPQEVFEKMLRRFQ
jgi:hypothetical protein